MATITATRKAYKEAGVVTDAQCVRVVRKDGVILRFTDSVQDLVMSTYIDGDGVSQSLPSDVTYTSIGYKATAADSGGNMTPGTVDLEGILATGHITRDDLKKGLYNQARIYVFYTNYNLPVEDEEKIITGFWGEASIQDGTYTTTFRSLIDVMSTRTGKSYSPTCTARLGDSKCRVGLVRSEWVSSTGYVELSAVDANVGDIVKPTTQNGWLYKCTVSGTSDVSEPAWPTTLGATIADGGATWEAIYPYVQTGTVDSSANKYSFVDTTRTEAAEWWAQGKLEFTSGDNTGVIVDVKQSSTTITIKQEVPFDIIAGDGYTITVGCRKRLSTDCVGKFANVHNNQSFPYIPGPKRISKFGGQ